MSSIDIIGDGVWVEGELTATLSATASLRARCVLVGLIEAAEPFFGRHPRNVHHVELELLQNDLFELRDDPELFAFPTVNAQ